MGADVRLTGGGKPVEALSPPLRPSYMMTCRGRSLLPLDAPRESDLALNSVFRRVNQGLLFFLSLGLCFVERPALLLPVGSIKRVWLQRQASSRGGSRRGVSSPVPPHTLQG